MNVLKKPGIEKKYKTNFFSLFANTWIRYDVVIVMCTFNNNNNNNNNEDDMTLTLKKTVKKGSALDRSFCPEFNVFSWQEIKEKKNLKK